MSRRREDPLPTWFKVVLVLTRLVIWTYVAATPVVIARALL